MRPAWTLIVIGFLSVVWGCGCGQSGSLPSPAKTDTSPSVIVTTAGLQDVVESLIGTGIRVQNIVPEEKFSPDWRPRKDAVRTLQQASLVLLNGAGWEPWVERVSLAPSRTLDTTARISSRLIQIPDAVTHRHGPEGSHSHAGTVWSCWLSPILLDQQIAEIESRLSRLLPERKSDVMRESNRQRLVLQQSQGLCEQLQAEVNSAKPVVLADSSCWLYLMREAGLDGPYLHWPVTGALQDTDLDELTAAAEKLPMGSVRLFLLHRQFSEVASERARQLGFRVVLLDDCLQRDSTVQLVDRVAANVQRLHAAMLK